VTVSVKNAIENGFISRNFGNFYYISRERFTKPEGIKVW